MHKLEQVPAILVLEDGTVFHGKSAGKIGTTTGEACFNTGMTGYQEVFTDPSYAGQILVMTNAHIGNYGTKDSEVQSRKIQIEGLICKKFTNRYSRPLADYAIQDYFTKEGVVGISDIDTRALVRHIRDKGAMNVIISSEISDIDELKTRLAKVPSMEGLELASRVSTEKVYYVGDPHAELKIAVLDLGVKAYILKSMADRGCYIKVFPAKTTFEEIERWNPDGYFLSNGPGDPASMHYAVETAKKILQSKKPLFGICLGHQILSLAVGITTYKMHHGHRGINHPVKNLETGRCEITSQNHGFGVNPDSVRAHHEEVEVTHMNLNDNTIEGIRLKNYAAFSVQYHPEASPGPHDSRYLFDDFVQLIREHKVDAGLNGKELKEAVLKSK